MPASQKAQVSASNAVVWGGSVDLEESKTRKSFGRPSLLWIDDFEPGLMLYKKMFEDLGFTVMTASTGEKGVQLVAIHNFDVVITDYEMPRMDGLAVASSIKALKPKTPVLLFSGSTLVPCRARRFVDAWCDKAGSRTELLGAIHRLLQKKPVRRLQPSLAA
jgi:CheY-like chemotaxis protein